MINEAVKYLGANQAGKWELMDYYNLHCYPLVRPNRKYKIQRNDNWCAMFTTVIAHKCGVSPDKFPYEVSVMRQLEWAIAGGKFANIASDVLPGDLILYSWKANGHCDHVGLVVDNLGGELLVIEGNKSDTVGYRAVSTASKNVYGYVRTGNHQTPSKTLKLDRLVCGTLNGVYGDGEVRKRLLGSDYRAVQERINRMA